MQYKWLSKNSNSKIIIFFNGWGMDDSVVSHLDTEDFDVLMFYDYNSLQTDFEFGSLKCYNEKNLIAWSMGVMVATNFDINYTSCTAINGTLKPIDELYGIHPKIYDLTIKGFNENGQKRFLKTIFGTEYSIQINRDLDNQKNELIALKNYNSNESFKYNKILISDNDKIIPTQNQCRYWNSDTNLKSAHCPFYLFKKWSELL